jgi:subtilisin family serine protease
MKVRILCAALLAMLVVSLNTPAVVLAQAVRPNVYVSEDVYRAMKSGSVPVIVTLHAPLGVTTQQMASGAALAQAEILNVLPERTYTLTAQYSHLAMLSMTVTKPALDALVSSPTVKAVTLDREVTLADAEARALIQSNDVVSLGFTGAGVRVAVIDSGINTSHVNLSDDLVFQACFRTEGDCGAAPNVAQDANGHGTHVAGIITGGSGIAPDAEIIAVKVFGAGSTTSTTNIMNGVNSVIANHATWQTDVVNMSLGGGAYSTQAACDADNPNYLAAFSQLNALGISIFVSTGNGASTTTIGAPGCVTGAIGVGSVGESVFTIAFSVCTDNGQPDKVSCYSNATPTQGPGELVDILAPGCNITSEWIGSSTATDTICGTSMASPAAAAVAALMLSADPTLTPLEIEEIMEDTGDMVSDYRTSVQYPRVNALNAVMALMIALDTPTNLTAVAVTDTQIDLNWDDVTGENGYQVQRSLDGVTWTTLVTTGGDENSYSDTTSQCSVNYYRVRAVDSIGPSFSAFSAVASAAARSCPAAPTGLSATLVSADDVELSWADAATNETAYEIERSLNGGAWGVVSSLPANGVLYLDNDLACGVYQYRVRAYNNVYNDYSAYSNTAEATLCAPANDLIANATTVSASGTFIEPNIRYATISVGDPAPSCRFDGPSVGSNNVWFKMQMPTAHVVTIDTVGTDIRLGGDNSYNDTIIAIYTGTPGSLTQVACNEDISGSDFLSRITDFSMSAGVEYYVLVTRWSNVPMSWDGVLQVNFAFVENTSPTLTATRLVDAVELSWTSVASATEYRVERRAVGTVTFTQVAIVTAPSTVYTDTITPCAAYNYRVRGYNGVTSSFLMYSNIVTGEPSNCAVLPPHDEWPNALTASPMPYTHQTLNVRFATINTNDPATAVMGDCTVGFPRRGSNSVWYTFTPTVSGELSMNTNGSLNNGGTQLDTFVSVFTGTYGAMTQVACDDESGTGAGSAITGLRLTAGVTYSFYVARWTTTAATGSDRYVVNFSYVPDPVPGAFDLSTPANNAVFTAPDRPETFTWTAATNATSYTLSIFDAASAVVVNVPSISGTTYTLTAGQQSLLTTGSAYTWSVTAVNAAGTIPAGNAPFAFELSAAPSVTIAPLTIEVGEDGTTAQYSVVLDTAPSADVTVSVLADGVQVSADALVLTFTTSDWSVPQFVTVSAIDDADVEGPHSSTIAHTVSSADAAYNGLSAAGVMVDIVDNDSPPTAALLLNGGFEDAVGIPLRPLSWIPWGLRNSDQVVCSAVAFEGTCAFRFAGKVAKARTLSQTVNLTDVGAGDVVQLSARVRGVNLTAGAQMVMVVNYADGSKATLRRVIQPGTYAYRVRRLSLTPSKDVESVIVRFATRKSTGRLFVDDVQLAIGPAIIREVGGGVDGALPLPPTMGQ